MAVDEARPSGRACRRARARRCSRRSVHMARGARHAATRRNSPDPRLECRRSRRCATPTASRTSTPRPRRISSRPRAGSTLLSGCGRWRSSGASEPERFPSFLVTHRSPTIATSARWAGGPVPRRTGRSCRTRARRPSPPTPAASTRGLTRTVTCRCHSSSPAFRASVAAWRDITRSTGRLLTR